MVEHRPGRNRIPPIDDTEPHLRGLWELAVDGDVEAGNQLLVLVQNQIRYFIKGMIFSRPDLETDEILQDFNLKMLWELRPRPGHSCPYDRNRPFMGQLVKTAKYFALRKLSPGRDRRNKQGSQGRTGRRAVVFSDLEKPGDGASGIPWIETVSTEQSFWPAGSEIRFSSWEILLWIFKHGGPPHAQIGFFYNVMDLGAEEARVAGAPRRGSAQGAVRLLSRMTVGEAFYYLMGVISGGHPDDGPYFWKVALPLRRRLEMPVDQVIRDPRILDNFPRRRELRVGDSRMSDYFGADPAASVASWTNRILGNARAALEIP